MHDEAKRQIEEVGVHEGASLLHALFVDSVDSIFVCELNGNILLANKVACETHGYSLEKLMSMNIENLDDSGLGICGSPHVDGALSLPSTAPSSLQSSLQSNDERELVHVKQNGETFPVRIRVNHVQFSSKKCLLFVVRDISKLKKQEAELRQSSKMKAIGQLAGGIAHDFNNTLGGVLGYAELALEDALPGSIQEDNLEKLIKAAERAKKLVRQIRTFSRQSTPKKDVVQLVPLIKDVVQFLRVSIPSSVEIDSSVSVETQPIAGDASKIHELLLNLATNAVDAMNENGTLRITLEQSKFDDPIKGVVGEVAAGHYAVIHVEDTGCGIEPSFLELIFEPFFSTKLPDEGAGMGLPVVFGVVRSHNGNIQIESTPGQGTAFHIFLPVVPVESIAAPVPYTLPIGGTETILVVDDEDLLVDICSKLLKSMGYNVLATMDVNEALDILQDKNTTVDLLLTDQTMPQMQGDELATRAMKIRPGLPVILCSGYSKRIDEKTMHELGIAKFIQKPVRKKELAVAVREAFETVNK